MGRITRANGIRFPRPNVEAIVSRICEEFRLAVPRGAISSVTMRLIGVTEAGWVTSGRWWTHTVLAAFLIAAKAYHLIVNRQALADMFNVSGATVQVSAVALERKSTL